MARYEVTKKSYLHIPGEGQDGGPRLFDAGAKVTLGNDVIPGSNLKPLDASAHAAVKRRDEAMKPAVPKEVKAAA